MLDLHTYWRALPEAKKAEFCLKVGVSHGYMESHLIHARKKPRMETIQAIVGASEKKLTHEQLFNFFLRKNTEAA